MATEQKPDCGECVRRSVCGLSVLLDGKAPADCRQFYRGGETHTKPRSR